MVRVHTLYDDLLGIGDKSEENCFFTTSVSLYPQSVSEAVHTLTYAVIGTENRSKLRLLFLVITFLSEMESLGDVNRESRIVSSLDNQGHCILSTLAEVVERVMSFLPSKALMRAACVCRLWRDCAQRKMKNRRRVTWISCSQTIVCKRQYYSFVEVVKEEIEKLYVVPETFLYFTDSNASVTAYCGTKSRTETSVTLKNLLPKECKILGLIAPGIVVTPMGSASNRPIELEEGVAGVALVLPKINGVKLQKFNFRKDNRRRGFDECKLEEAGLKNNPELKVVLIFGYSTWKPGANRFLHQVLNPLNEKSIIIAGGQIDHLVYSSEKAQDSDRIGIAGLSFSGPQIQGATVLLDQYVYDERTADSAMQRLKAANIPEYNSVGFMFACIGRGEQHYKKSNVEADTFRKHFPNVPLLGFFGNGEIGCDRVVSGNFTLRECNDVKDDLLHGYTTVMTIIHFGPSK
ncbi:F-box only protein 22-like [Bombina bombina]|uniref:F-box only protein 22-like n=1 Tax=Bombina bombina TaxID=8345 RepID=UPI00235AD105|nr:F-box only protein 22-like [Bombina bombina]